MAIPIAKKVTMIKLYFALGFVTLFMCSACQLFDPAVQEYETQFKSQKMIISSYSSEYASKHGSGFVVMMESDVSHKMDAPNSMEFRDELAKQLSEERSHGNNYCPGGYEIHRIINFKHWYTNILVDCKSMMPELIESK